MTCPRCHGYLELRSDGQGDRTCLQCGYVRYSELPLAYTPEPRSTGQYRVRGKSGRSVVGS